MGGGLLRSAVQVLLEAGILLPSVSGSHSMAAESACHSLCSSVGSQHQSLTGVLSVETDFPVCSPVHV